MLGSPRIISLRVPNLEEAKQWYRAALGQEPSFDAPFAVGFRVGDCAFLLVPAQDSEHPDERCVAYFGVDDIEAAYARLIEAGANARSEITFTMLKSRMAKIMDPFGNVLGIITGAEQGKSVDSRPSESAMTVAFSRALAAHDDREGLRGPDHLAEMFLNEESKKAMGDRAARQWFIEQLAGTHEYFLARTLCLDEAVTRSLREDVPQLVFLGAGYDSRSYRFEKLIKNTRIFELDVENTQQRKRTLLEGSTVRIPEQLRYVTINFEREAIGDVLAQAGFDRGQRTVFVWEGVTYYLSSEAVDETLAAVRQNAPAGSAVYFDYLIQAPDMATRYKVKEVFDAWRKAYSGEPVRFGIDEGTIAEFLSNRGYRLVEHLGPAQLEQRFLTRPDGTLCGRVVALFALVQAAVSG